MRRAKVVAGLLDQTWREINVEVAEDPNYVLEDDEVKEKAIQLAKLVFSSEEVSFFLVTYVEPIDFMDGIV